jgi:CheY-like chemotaxis protein
VAYESHPDVILLDSMMPETDGFDTCRNLRRMTNTPILILTALSTENDVIRRLYQVRMIFFPNHSGTMSWTRASGHCSGGPGHPTRNR